MTMPLIFCLFHAKIKYKFVEKGGVCMEKEFVPKKTITVQLSIELYQKMGEILTCLGLTKTKLMEKFIAEAYDDLFSNKRV